MKTENQLDVGKTLEQLRHNFKEGLELVSTLLDEARVEAHLGKTEAEARLAALSARLSTLQRGALSATAEIAEKAIKTLRTAAKG